MAHKMPHPHVAATQAGLEALGHTPTATLSSHTHLDMLYPATSIVALA